MIRGVAQETRAAMRFLTTRHYTAPGVESLQARQWTGWATDRGHPAFAIASTTTTRSIFPIGRGVKNRGVGFQAAKAVGNSVLGFGPRPRLLYRVDGIDRVASGRKGEPVCHLADYIRRTYPRAELIAVNTPLHGLEVDRTGAFKKQRKFTPEQVAKSRKRPKRRKAAAIALQGEVARLWHPPSRDAGPVRYLAGAAAAKHVQDHPSQPRMHWKPPTPEPRPVAVPQEWKPRLWSDPAMTWAVIRGREFEFEGIPPRPSGSVKKGQESDLQPLDGSDMRGKIQ